MPPDNKKKKPPRYITAVNFKLQVTVRVSEPEYWNLLRSATPCDCDIAGPLRE